MNSKTAEMAKGSDRPEAISLVFAGGGGGIGRQGGAGEAQGAQEAESGNHGDDEALTDEYEAAKGVCCCSCQWQLSASLQAAWHNFIVVLVYLIIWGLHTIFWDFIENVNL